MNYPKSETLFIISQTACSLCCSTWSSFQAACAAVRYRRSKPPAVCAAVRYRRPKTPAVCAAVRYPRPTSTSMWCSTLPSSLINCVPNHLHSVLQYITVTAQPPEGSVLQYIIVLPNHPQSVLQCILVQTNHLRSVLRVGFLHLTYVLLKVWS
jgi:hypothetical protein